jgi:hypothetical protein
VVRQQMANNGNLPFEPIGGLWQAVAIGSRRANETGDLTRLMDRALSQLRELAEVYERRQSAASAES